MKLAIALAAAALALAGCSSGAADPATRTAPASSAPTAASLSAMSEQFRCLGYTDDDSTELFVEQSGDCIMENSGSGTVRLLRFGTVEAMANYWDAAKQFGGTADACVTVELVAVCPEDPTDLPPIRDALT